jgi:hypothetical protein
VFAVTACEPQVDGIISALLRCDAAQIVYVVAVGLDVAISVVDGNRPESVDMNQALVFHS